MKAILVLIMVGFLLVPGESRAETTHLLITQVQITGGTGATNNDFVEIYNPTDGDVDLFGYHLAKRTKTGTSDFLLHFWTQPTIIPAGKFYLLAHEEYTTIAAVPDRTFTEPLSNDNGIALKSPSNQVVDSVGWGEAANAFVETAVFPINPTAGNSLARKFSAEHIFSDTNNNNEDFEAVTAAPRNLAYTWPEPEPEPEPEEETEPEEEPEEVEYSTAVRISEFLVNPQGADAGSEWVELYSTEDADISSWILDDEGDAGAAGSTALTIPNNTHISAGAYLVVQIPSGKFALNNTGGDTVRLMHPDFQIADSVSYSGTAPEAQSRARNTQNTFAWTSIVTKGAGNQFPVEVEEEGPEEEEPEDAPVIDYIQINEVFPNPQGSDTGNEFVEIINIGPAAVNIHNWILDDGEEDSPIGSSSYKLPSQTINPGQLIQLKIPSGKFTLNNTGEETVRLFDENKKLVNFVSYSGSTEGQSYSLMEDDWLWTLPTPGEANTVPEEVAYSEEIIISRLLPEPGEGQEEYIELMNLSDEAVSLKDWVISDEAREYKIKDLVIEAGAAALIFKSQSKISLNNFGTEVVTLTNPDGEIVSQVEYADPPKNFEFSFVGAEHGPLIRSGEEAAKRAGRPRLVVIVFSLLLWYIYIVFTPKTTPNE